ncbi:hypothetical protein [Mucilaginibacter sp. dw_454]|uniref:hypothetical protein n=1 Tax=Mucilaginibacter sp. dw_454 TaxID=2720079 RepID=UPI001BD29AFA|nr:hypothetical protein [Mucilaginibacter sp. dw_454]
MKLFLLLLLCCAFFTGKAAPAGHAYQNDHNTKISKVLGAQNLPANPFIKFNLIGGNQEAIRQVHNKVNSPVYTAYLATQTANTCIRYFNFFSGYNHHRYSLRNADFLFPFHVFW